MAELGPACLLRPNSPGFERILFFSIYFFILENIIASKFSKTKLPPPLRLQVLQCQTAGNHRGPWRLGSICFQKIVTLLYELGWRSTLYETFNFDKIYNFATQFFSFEVILRLKQMIYCLDLDTDN
jgi:hypothetical protein